MSRSLVVALVALLVAVGQRTAFAQDTTAARLPATGTRVRATVVTAIDAVTGVLIDQRAGTLVVAREMGDTVVVPVAQLVRLDVSDGIRTFKLKGAMLGFGVGAGAGAIVGLATYRKPDCAHTAFICLDFGPGYDAMFGAAIGGIGGALAGTLIGARAVETWTRIVGVDGARPRIGMAPCGSVAITSTLTF